MRPKGFFFQITKSRFLKNFKKFTHKAENKKNVDRDLKPISDWH
jgi:hypothetical protein